VCICGGFYQNLELNKKKCITFFLCYLCIEILYVIGYLPTLPEQPVAAYFVNVLKMFVEGELWFLFHCI